MAKRKQESLAPASDQARRLQARQLGKFTLLNDEKLGRVMDWIEGVVKPKPEEEAILAASLKLGQEEAILALYDRLGGAVRLGERILKTGAFYDFATKTPLVKPNLTEDDFGDEMVLVRKKTKKGVKSEDVGTRMKRLEAKTKVAKI